MPHNPQHNEVTERNNRTIVGAAQAIFERELDLHAVKELLVLKDEPPDVHQP